MGVDFLKSKNAVFEKKWDFERLRSSRYRLLAEEPKDCNNYAAERSIQRHILHDGDEVLLRSDGDRVEILVDLVAIANLIAPEPEIVKAVRAAGGYARGTVTSVDPNRGLMGVQLL